MTNNNLFLIGYGSGVAGADVNAGEGPFKVQKSTYVDYSQKLKWLDILKATNPKANQDDIVFEMCNKLATMVSSLINEQKKFCVIGGDHTSAIGTWSGAAAALKEKGDFGLIWIDAHMDAHTPETSESGRLHGMPLAVLLGHGNKRLTSIAGNYAKIKPENLCLIGVRSFEKGEADFLKKNNVKIYYMPEIEERGFSVVLAEAVQHMKAKTAGFGMSLDLDSLDPEEAPGVDVPEKNGIHVKDLYEGLKAVVKEKSLMGTEIVEFDPMRDIHDKTEKIIAKLLEIL